MSFFHKKNVTKCLGHHYAIWTSDSNFLLAPNFLSWPSFQALHTKQKSIVNFFLALCLSTMVNPALYRYINQMHKKTFTLMGVHMVYLYGV